MGSKLKIRVTGPLCLLLRIMGSKLCALSDAYIKQIVKVLKRRDRSNPNFHLKTTMMISDLPEELVEEILSRVSIISLRAVRSTCKRWNDLSKDRVLCKAEARQQFCGFMIKGSKVCSMRFDLHGIQNNDVELVEPSIKQIDKFNQVEMLQVFHCNGLLLLVMRSTMGINSRLAVWNPYLGKIWSIQPRNTYDCFDLYTLGYDNNRNHKILRYDEIDYYEIYDFKSHSWRVLDIIPDTHIIYWACSMSIKGNTYFVHRGEKIGGVLAESCLLCFDFTRERLGPRLPLPFQVACHLHTVTLSSIREEQLAVLSYNWEAFEMEIWVTTKIEPNAVLWSSFLTVIGSSVRISAGSFFIEQEKKLAVVFDKKGCIDNVIAYIIGETGYLRTVDLGVAIVPYRHLPLPVYSYAPSLVQINQSQELSLIGKKKRSRLLTSFFYSTLFVLFVIFLWFIYSVFF